VNCILSAVAADGLINPTVSPFFKGFGKRAFLANSSFMLENPIKGRLAAASPMLFKKVLFCMESELGK
ncbi:MAG: hypothetical protein HWE09_02830, partial [Cyclobacteriaceae bacterium]|nr:hypothetical protein [Cyclobacteriaceae bacterium]